MSVDKTVAETPRPSPHHDIIIRQERIGPDVRDFFVSVGPSHRIVITLEGKVPNPEMRVHLFGVAVSLKTETWPREGDKTTTTVELARFSGQANAWAKACSLRYRYRRPDHGSDAQRVKCTLLVTVQTEGDAHWCNGMATWYDKIPRRVKDGDQ